MKIAVVGSRESVPKNIVRNILLKKLLGKFNNTVVTGGARGVDRYAIDFCKDFNIPCQVIRPLTTKNKLYFLYRNIEMLTMDDKILAFWDGESRGTKFVIDYATSRKKDIEIYNEVGDKIEPETLYKG